jgi:hypothetical protein
MFVYLNINHFIHFINNPYICGRYRNNNLNNKDEKVILHSFSVPLVCILR